MDGPEPKTPADGSEGARSPAADPSASGEAEKEHAAPPKGSAEGSLDGSASDAPPTEPLRDDGEDESEDESKRETKDPARTDVSAASDTETPQTASIEPALADTPGAPRRGPPGRRLSRLRAALAVIGSIAAIGAIVLPFAVGARGETPVGIAKAASLAGAVSGAGLAFDDAGKDAGADTDDDAAAPKPTAWRVARLADDPTVTLVDGTMGKRPLLAVLAAAGLPRSESHRVVDSLSDVRDVDHFDPKDTYVLARDKASGRVVAYEIAGSPVDVWQAREDVSSDGTTRLIARRLELVSERVRIRKSVLVGADLRASFADAGLAPIDDLLSMLDDALDGHTELADIRPGARLRLIATAERVDGAFVRWSSLDAVEYFPAGANAPPVRVYWFGDDDHRHGWYDARGRQPTHGGWRTPLPLAHVVSPFNPHRMHPVLHVVMPHNGVDFRAPVGAPVYATAPGVVTSVGNDGPCGNKVEIAHAGGISSVYCHLSRFAAGIHAGQHVESRQLIAYVGQTGRVTGPHLHFGIKRNGTFIDPMTLRLDGVRVVPRSRRDDFDRQRAQIDAELDAIPLPAAPAPGAPSATEPGRQEGEGETFYEEP